jgi:nicotinate-nucleotide adenylyltransferase
MTTVALFGGSFNPPHIAHQMACLYLLETQPVDLVRMMPTYKHVFGKELAPFEHRLAMCRLAASPFGDKVEVSDIKRTLGGQSKTHDTLVALGKSEPTTKFRLVVGEDILDESHKWHRWQDVIALAPPIVIGREGYVGSATAEIRLPGVSSTEIRRRLGEGQSALPLVSRAVMDYIAEQGLYQ